MYFQDRMKASAQGSVAGSALRALGADGEILRMSSVVHLGRLIALNPIVLLCIASKAQSPKLGDTRAKTEETLRSVCGYLNDELKKNHGQDSAASVTALGDTLIYRVSSDDEVKYEYVFANDLCVAIRVQFSCLTCLHHTYRKWFFKGQWRVDESGYLYRSKNPARASIKRVIDCPFLYEVHLTKMEPPLPNEVFKKMKKAKKKQIGTWDYLLIGP